MKQQRIQSRMQILLVLLLCTIFAFQVKAQGTGTITGTVVDNTNTPIIGASILVQGTTNGTITDLDGIFTLSNVPSKGVLQVSFIGYKAQDVQVNGQKKFTIKLAEDTQALDEVVVVGYGVQRKSDLTGAVASVKASDVLKSTPTANVSDALQGRLAGVSVISGSGDPSKESTIRVRGINSITAETGPLVVIDGFIGGTLKSLNPSDIQSIEVLKDASATAVYGSRGANGVILVTTKNPQQDKTVVSFNGFANFKTIMAYPDVLSPTEYANLANDYGKEFYESQNMKPVTYYNPEQIKKFENGTEGYNYAKNMFNNPALSQNYELSITNGGEKTSFLASVRYENSEGIIKNSKNEQFNWRLKVDSKIKKWLKVGLNFWGDYSTASGPKMDSYEGLLISAINFPNTIKPQDEDGNYNNELAVGGLKAYNPMGLINEIDSKTQRLNNRLQGYVEFNIIDGLTFRSQLGVTFNNTLANTTDNEKSYYYFKNTKTQAEAKSAWNFSWLNTNTLNYIKEFNKNHRINATAVFEQQYTNDYNHAGIASNLMFPTQLGYDGLAWADNFQTESEREINTLLSGMFRLNYVFMNRYMLTASIRADGSSNLASKWDYFPSVAVAWDIKQEAFMRDVEPVDQLKIRAGYGSVGNQSVAPYRIYSKMKPVRNPDGTTSYVVDRPRAEDLKWERNEQINIGLDLSMFNNRVTMNVDWYNKVSKDILLEVKQPDHLGWPSLLKNAGEIKNTGIEVTIGAIPVSTKNWNWNTNLTLSHNKGTFEKIPTLNKMQTQEGKYENEIFRMIEGEKLGTFWGYNYLGVWKTNEVNAKYLLADGTDSGQTNGQFYGVIPGQAKYEDKNGDGKTNTDDQGIIGCGQPIFNWGWSNTLSYKDFDLTLFVVGFHGFDIYNATEESGYGLLNGIASDVVTPKRALLNRWTKSNENSDIPGFVYVKTPVKGTTSQFVEKGSFIKVKSITLGYNIPASVCKSIYFNNIRVYASIQNPFHITKYSGLDPEAALGTPLTQGADWGAYPNGRNYLVGLNFSF